MHDSIKKRLLQRIKTIKKKELIHLTRKVKLTIYFYHYEQIMQTLLLLFDFIKRTTYVFFKILLHYKVELAFHSQYKNELCFDRLQYEFITSSFSALVFLSCFQIVHIGNNSVATKRQDEATITEIYPFQPYSVITETKPTTNDVVKPKTDCLNLSTFKQD